MTVSNTTARSGPYNGNGVTVAFDYDFRILDETHITVVQASALGVETVLTLADYTVSGVGASGGGAVTLDTALPTGETLTLVLDVPFTQEIDLENQGAYYAETIERALDLAAMRSQQLAEELSRAVKISVSADVAELDDLLADIARVADSADNIDTVSAISADVTAVAAVAGSIAGIPAQVTAVQAARDATLAALDSFDDRYLGSKTADPTLDNDGNALVGGALYFNSVGGVMKVYTGSVWVSAYVSGTGFAAVANNLSDLASASAALTNLGLTANGASLVKAANYAAMRTLLSLVAGTDFYSVAGANAAFQAIDPQLSSLIRQNSQSAAYTLVLTDGGKHIYHPAADTTARIWTIPANSAVAFPIGTAITFDNDFGAGAITIAITTDTLVLVGTVGSTGSRTLASGGQATAIKVTSTRWRISGVGLT